MLCGLAILIAGFLLASCGQPPGNGQQAEAETLTAARAGFVTTLNRKESTGVPPDVPDAGDLNLITYPSALGDMAAYLSPAQGPVKHPAIIWLTGGFSNSISAAAWIPGEWENDQSAMVFRQAGVVTMYPSLRGGNTNPGSKEAFYGEVDDVVAAMRWLKQQPNIDPDRVYLGGHSTGGTLALLVAETTPGFRAVFCFGPVDDVSGYGQEILPFSIASGREVRLRSPMHWLAGINTPTFIMEGTGPPGNTDCLPALSRSGNPLVHCEEVAGGNHFSILRPLCGLVAAKILADCGTRKEIQISHEEITGAMRQ